MKQPRAPDRVPAAERKADDTTLSAEVAGYRAYLGKDKV
jgi:hypothetical protein